MACQMRASPPTIAVSMIETALLAFEPLYALAGFMVGVLVGITGVGGGALMTPILVLAFGFHPATAVGTDLLYAAITKTVGTAVHNKKSSVDWRLVGLMATGSLPAALVTLVIMHQAGGLTEGAVGILNFLLGVMLLLTSAAVLFRERIVEAMSHRIQDKDHPRTRQRTIILGLALGILVTITSVGAGAIGTTALLILYPRLPLARIVGTDIAHAVPLTLVAGLGHLAYGAVDLGLMGSLLVGSIPGIILASLFGAQASDAKIRPILAIALFAVALKLLGLY